MPAFGSLKCQYVLCAACPMWSFYPEKVECEALLKKTLLRVFEYADKELKAKSIALPALGSGKPNSFQKKKMLKKNCTKKETWKESLFSSKIFSLEKVLFCQF